jgi:hypothetical protein
VYYTDGARKALIAIELTKSGDVIVPDDVTEIAPYAGYNEQFITGLVVGDNCTVIGDSAFRNTYMIQYVTLGESVTEIGDEAFRYNGYIVTIIMPKSLKKVGEEAFLKKVGDKKYRAYKNIYFEGTKAEWEAIRFEKGNDHLIGLDDNNEPIVSIAFYSETEPNGDGLYWYYANGKPTLWN